MEGKGFSPGEKVIFNNGGKDVAFPKIWREESGAAVAK